MVVQAPSKYKPGQFETNVLQHSNVKLTWDQDDPKRMKTVGHSYNNTWDQNDPKRMKMVRIDMPVDLCIHMCTDICRHVYGRVCR